MESWILLVGLGLGLGGALLVALADAWLSRSLLVYLDAVEAHHQSGPPDVEITRRPYTTPSTEVRHVSTYRTRPRCQRGFAGGLWWLDQPFGAAKPRLEEWLPSTCEDLPMASGWFLDGQPRNLWGEAGAGSPVPIKQRISSGEHAAVLENPDQFDSLHWKKDFLGEGVHTVFGIKDGEADLQGLYFQANLFTPAEAKQWLQERRLEPLVFTEATESRAWGQATTAAGDRIIHRMEDHADLHGADLRRHAVRQFQEPLEPSEALQGIQTALTPSAT